MRWTSPLVIAVLSAAACNLGNRAPPPDLMVNTSFVDRAGAVIADPGRLERSIRVTATGRIVRATVEAIVGHRRPADLRLTLISPAGTELELGARLSEGRDYYRYALPLIALQGETATGTWRLHVDDTTAGQAGTLVVWALAFEALNPS